MVVLFNILEIDFSVGGRVFSEFTVGDWRIQFCWHHMWMSAGLSTDCLGSIFFTQNSVDASPLCPTL